jgi:allantoicase
MFEDELTEVVDVSYVRFNIFPDGGVARLRLFGRPT